MRCILAITLVITLIMAFSGCVESEYMILYDGQLAHQLQIYNQVNTVGGNTEIEYHSIMLHKKAQDNVNVSFVYESTEGINFYFYIDNESMSELELEPGIEHEIKMIYEYDSYLKAGNYTTTFSVLPCD